MPSLTEEFAYIVEKFGLPSGVAVPDKAVLDRYRERLPHALVDFWALHGQGLMLDGKFQFCDPERFAPISQLVFGEDKDLPAARCHIFGYSAFGMLLAWSEDHDVVKVSLIDGTVSCLDLAGRSAASPADVSIAISLFQLDAGVFDAFDEDGKRLFARARKALGKLQSGQVYGFAPILALGGAPRLSQLKAVGALEHFSLLAQAVQCHLIDTSTMAMRKVRVLG